jgi:hypothetical protein
LVFAHLDRTGQAGGLDLRERALQLGRRLVVEGPDGVELRDRDLRDEEKVVSVAPFVARVVEGRIQALERRAHRFANSFGIRHHDDYDASRRKRPRSEMRAAYMSIERAPVTYLEGMTLASQNAELGNRCACRRR